MEYETPLTSEQNEQDGIYTLWPLCEAEPQVTTASLLDLEAHLFRLNVGHMLFGLHDEDRNDLYTLRLDAVIAGQASEEEHRIYAAAQHMKRRLRKTSPIDAADRRVEEEVWWFAKQGIDINAFEAYDRERFIFKLPPLIFETL